jgi:hypothetical protein
VRDRPGGALGEVGPCLGITRVRLQEILLAGAAAVPHRLGAAVTSLTQDGERVSVGFGDGPPATTTSWSGRTASTRPSAGSP